MTAKARRYHNALFFTPGFANACFLNPDYVIAFFLTPGNLYSVIFAIELFDEKVYAPVSGQLLFARGKERESKRHLEGLENGDSDAALFGGLTVRARDQGCQIFLGTTYQNGKMFTKQP
jgi:hypothetical protein